jgi:hypothetical protein
MERKSLQNVPGCFGKIEAEIKFGNKVATRNGAIAWTFSLWFD